MRARIVGTGSCIPENKVTNDDLALMVETSDEWIYTRTGIHSRQIAKKESNAEMAAQAARRAMAQAGVTPEEIDFILVATSTPDSIFPGVACLVQEALGAENAFGFDISAACSGFLFALNTAQGFIQSGQGKTGLVIGSEVMSRILDWKDRSTCVLFGDGAGAVVVRGEETGFEAAVMHGDGSRGGVLSCKDKILMDGQEVFKFAVRQVPEVILELLEGQGLTPDKIRYFVLHQANIRIIQSVAKRLGVGEEHFPSNLEKLGNTSAASIPLLLDEMNRKQQLCPGDKIILSGFGGGLTWGAALFSW